MGAALRHLMQSSDSKRKILQISVQGAVFKNQAFDAEKAQSGT
jgi:hypothetical protein